MALQCTFLPDALCNFPAINDTLIREARKNIDDGFRGIVRSWGTVIDTIVQPLQWFLNYLEWLFTNTPWFIVLIVMMGVVYLASRNIKIVIGTGISMALIGVFGLWNDTMVTLAMVTVCTMIAIIVGLPIGILMARSDRLQAIINPTLDVMQTMPSFVYLIPVVVIFA
jgi:glycine betaine/proline transport system permease protein